MVSAFPFALGLLEILQLRLDHCALHVMSLAGGDTLQKGILIQLQVNEVDLHGWRAVSSHTHDITVLLLQGRAGNHHARRGVEVVCFRGREGLDGCIAERDEPVPAVCVCERDAAAHLFFVLLRVELCSR